MASADSEFQRRLEKLIADRRTEISNLMLKGQEPDAYRRLVGQAQALEKVGEMISEVSKSLYGEQK